MALLGLVILFVCSIPVTSGEEVINASFTVAPGAKYGPNDAGTGYHTRIFGKSVLKGEVFVEGEGIHLTAGFYNTEHLRDIYVVGRFSFVISPADDLYVFTFDNTNGRGESSVRFRLEEVWTRPAAFSSPPLLIVGLTGLLLFPIGVAILIITHLRSGAYRPRYPMRPNERLD